MEEYVCVTLLSRPGESAADFSARLSRFWTHMLRTRPADFEKMYAEAVAFENRDGRLTRQYLVDAEALPVLEAELQAAAAEFVPIDPDDTLTRYEAVASEWMRIEH